MHWDIITPVEIAILSLGLNSFDCFENTYYIIWQPTIRQLNNMAKEMSLDPLSPHEGLADLQD